MRMVGRSACHAQLSASVTGFTQASVLRSENMKTHSPKVSRILMFAEHYACTLWMCNYALLLKHFTSTVLYLTTRHPDI